MIRTRIQKLSLPFTLKRATCGGSWNSTLPSCKNALLVSEKFLPLTTVANGPFRGGGPQFDPCSAPDFPPQVEIRGRSGGQSLGHHDIERNGGAALGESFF